MPIVDIIAVAGDAPRLIDMVRATTAVDAATAATALEAIHPAASNVNTYMAVRTSTRDYRFYSVAGTWVNIRDPLDGTDAQLQSFNGVTFEHQVFWNAATGRWTSTAFESAILSEANKAKLEQLVPDVPTGYDETLVGGYTAGTQVFESGKLYAANKDSNDPPGVFVAADWDEVVTEAGKSVTAVATGELPYTQISYLTDAATYTLPTVIDAAEQIEAIIPPAATVTVGGIAYTNASAAENQALTLYNNGSGWVRESAGSAATPDMITIQHEYADATDRTTEAGYTVTQADIDNRRIFQQGDDNTLWRATGAVGAVVWEQVGGQAATLIVFPGSGNNQEIERRNVYWQDETIGAAPTAIGNGWYETAVVQSTQANFDGGVLPVTVIERFTAAEDPANPGTYYWIGEGEASEEGNTKFITLFDSRLESFSFDFHDRRPENSDTRRQRYTITVDELSTGNAEFSLNTDPSYAGIPIQAGFTRLLGRMEVEGITSGYDIIIDWQLTATGDYRVCIQDSFNLTTNTVSWGINTYGAVDSLTAKYSSSDPIKPTWQAFTGYESGTQILAQAPAGVAEIQGDWYVGTANSVRPNTIAALDATEWAEWSWEALGVQQQDIVVATLADRPDPATLQSGSTVAVVNDPITENNRTYTVLGPVGGAGTGYDTGTAAAGGLIPLHLNNGDTAQVGRINIAPDSTTLVAPAVVADGIYATADLFNTSSYSQYQEYFANAAGDAWIAENAATNIEGLVSFFQWSGDKLIASGEDDVVSFGIDLSLTKYAFFTFILVIASNNQYKITKVVDFTNRSDLPGLPSTYNNAHVDVGFDRSVTDLSIGDIAFREGGIYSIRLIGAEFFALVETGLPQLPFHTITLDPAGTVSTFLNGQTSVNLHDMKLAQVAVTLNTGNRLALATPNPAPGVTVENYELGLLNIVTASDRTIRLEQETI